ncbi:hypothetical protein ABIE41_001412 [Bosea sp. OAE506]|uniref:PilZ domain-containing protein n=1 Tax=Bosea sp. OAE506 TaxID=2663870 RepID=UPI00178BC622
MSLSDARPRIRRFGGSGVTPSGSPARLRLATGIAIDCIAHNVSTGGARLKLEAPTQLPLRFKLTIGVNREVHQAVVCWIEGRELGIAFEFEDDLGEDGADD